MDTGTGLLAPPPDNFGAFAIWFVPLAAITWIGTTPSFFRQTRRLLVFLTIIGWHHLAGTILSLTQSIGLAAVLGTLALSSTLFAVGNWVLQPNESSLH